MVPKQICKEIKDIEKIGTDTVLYKNAFSNGIDISYTSTFSGVKCNIILEKPIEKYDYEFIAYTDGYTITYSKEGKLVVLNNEDTEIAIFSDIIVYDNSGKQCIGKISVETIIDKKEYLITISVDNEFLSDVTVEYPVVIDPSITLILNSSNAIEYVAAYSNSTSSTNIGTSNCSNLLIGMSSLKGIGRALYRFPYIYQNIFGTSLANRIESVILVQNVENANLYSMTAKAYTGSAWSGSTTYSNISWNSYISNLYSYTTYGGIYAYNQNSRYMYLDITDFVEIWRDDPLAANPSRGIMLINSMGEYIMNSNYVSIYPQLNITSPYVATFSPYLEITYTVTVGIMLDAGHTLGDNQGAYLNYYEGTKMWDLHLYLKSSIQSLGFNVGTTRTSSTANPSLSARGYMADNFDMFLSLHSNAVDNSSSTNRIVIIYDVNNKNDADDFALEIGTTIRNVMNTNGLNISSVQLYQRPVLNSDGTIHYEPDGSMLNWYGVLRYAAETNCPLYYILEHSFHSNYASSLWLYTNTNLQALASAEAQTIDDFYY
ncbi:MAG: N-acetylmuramoyl-L-alanine amidase [Eubacteriales bacterium]|nr:N-acetylmuramoyl-L-alanine amidase [Eubacteriales bacterium]